MRFAAVVCSTLTGLIVLSSQAVAQQKTIKACQEEWRANKAVNQANGITEKSYVDQCRAGGVPTQPTAAPAQPNITDLKVISLRNGVAHQKEAVRFFPNSDICLPRASLVLPWPLGCRARD